MKRSAWLFLFLLITPAGAQAGEKTTYMVAMRDAMQLATDVHTPPTGSGPWPVVLIRTTYGRRGSEDVAQILNPMGYAAVIQDVRGRGGSEGTDTVFQDDGWGENQDGYDTVEWIAAQPWCDGKIGTFGASALGITQYMMAGAVPPHLTCQFVIVAAPSLYHYSVYPGGVYRKSLVDGWLQGQGSTHALPIIEEHSSYDDHWRPVDLSTRYELVDVPMYHVGGWFDIYTQGTIDAFVALQEGGAPGAFGRQKMIIGPWTHSGEFDVQQGELEYPGNSIANLLGEVMRWYTYHLKGVANRLYDEPPIRYYVIGDVDDPEAPGNEWRYALDWPPPNEPTAFYFQSGEKLAVAPPMADHASQTYAYDPNDPAPTIGGNNLNLAAGPFDQRSVEARDDVLVFTTDPLEEPVEITGRIRAKLHASSDARDTDWVVALTDVYPDGRSMLMAQGALRARHRNSLETEDFMEPDSIYEFTVDLWSLALVFNRGHRIRVSVTSSSNPRYDPNPNTGAPFRGDDQRVVANNTVYFDRGHPSHLLLPVSAAGPTRVAEHIGSPPESSGLEVFPNPARTVGGSVTIRVLSRPGGAVRGGIYDLLGRRVRHLRLGEGMGTVYGATWDLRDDNGAPVGAGIYFARIETGTSPQVAKIVVIR